MINIYLYLHNYSPLIKIMELRINSKTMLTLLYIISWIIFIGVSIEAGSFITNAIFTLTGNGEKAEQIGLENLYAFNPAYYVIIIVIMTIVAVMRAILFYLIIKLLHDKKFQMTQPFNSKTGRFIFNISYLAAGIGISSFWGAKYVESFVKQGAQMPGIQTLRFGGADAWLFMGATLLVIAHLFKRGIEIQTENELTI